MHKKLVKFKNFSFFFSHFFDFFFFSVLCYKNFIVRKLLWAKIAQKYICLLLLYHFNETLRGMFWRILDETTNTTLIAGVGFSDRMMRMLLRKPGVGFWFILVSV